MRKILVAGVSILTLSACNTSLDTRPVSLQQSRIDGVPYALTVLQLETKVTHRLVKCEVIMPGAPGHDASVSPDNASLLVEFKTTVENKPTYPAAEYFVLDYSALASVLKSSSFKITYHDNRMLKTFNVAAQDKSIDVAVETVKAGVSIAKLVAGVPVSLGAAGADEAPAFSCPTATVVAEKPGPDGKPVFEERPLLDLRKGVAALQKKAVESLASVNTRLAALNTRAASNTLSEADKEQITELTDKGTKLAKEIAGYSKQLAEFDKTLAYSETLRWQPDGNLAIASTIERSFNFAEDDFDDTARGKARKRWMATLFNQEKAADFEIAFGPLDPAFCNPKDEECDPEQAGPRIARDLSLGMMLRPDHVVLSQSDATAVATRLRLSDRKEKKSATYDHVRGVVARQPVPGQFLICRGYAVPCTPTVQSKLLDERLSVPQLGAYVVLPYSNGFGQDNVLNAEFAATGEPTMIEYQEKSAVALEAAKGLTTSADNVNSFFQDLEATRLADAEREAGEPLKELERQVAILEQEKKIAELREDISPSNPLTLLQQRASILEQEKKVAELEAAVNGEPDAYQEEIDRLTKELELLKLQAQILEQREILGGGV